MKKYLTKLFSDIFNKMTGIQLKYQAFTSLEVSLRLRIMDSQNEADFINQKLGTLGKKLAELETKDILTMDENDDKENLKKQIKQFLTSLQYHNFVKEKNQIRLDDVCAKKLKFEHEHPNYF